MTALGDYFRAQAEWRSAKAEDYPEDRRNAQSAVALVSVAAFVDENSELAVVKALGPHLFQGAILGGEESQRAVARYGYGYGVVAGQHEEFLDDLVELCVADAYMFVAEHDDDPTGTLFEFEVDAARDDVFLGPYYFRRRAGSTQGELEAWVQEARATSGGAS